MHPNRLQQIWKKNQVAINAWLTIPSPWVAEVTAHFLPAFGQHFPLQLRARKAT